MEPLPSGANFVRGKMLWEIALHIAGNPLTPYYGPRDLCISVGSGSGESFRPSWRFSTGSPVLARSVARGDLEFAFVNPSGLLTQAYRGTLAALHAGELDAIFDEGLVLWFEEALAAGMQVVDLDEHAFQTLEARGWRRVVIPAGTFPHLLRDAPCIDYSGWPLYTRAALPDEDAYNVCDAIFQRQREILWESTFERVEQLGSEAEATPVDVPLHPGALRWYAEHGVARAPVSANA